MKVSLNWLKDYIDLSEISVADIVNKLTMSGLEVEEVTNQKEIYKDFIVGLVKEKKKHPNADKLSLCTVSDGKKDFQVICGAPNVEDNQKVVFAPIGTLIPKGNFKITKAKIRGIESFGMICSEAELELSDDHSGIMVLNGDAIVGSPITEALSLNDVIFEVAITPNRSDALSHIGVARDLSAIFDLELKLPSIEINESPENINEAVKIEIIDSQNCPRYTSKVVKNISVKDSPNWLKKRLINIGLRPINNIVDVTNYVMYETGQPLHAFDLNNLKGNKIIVQSTQSESIFVTLDSKERKLPKNTLMICDAEKDVAIAGIMGGENSEVNQNTKNILIESAYFNPASVRKTGKNINLSTEASYRFERGTDPNNTDFAAKRAAKLISELSGGKVLKGIVDVYPQKIENKEVRLRFERISKILGFEISKDKVLKIIDRLCLKIIFESESKIRVSVPTFRNDIEREIDLIEEIARINDYENIPTISKISTTLGQKIDESFSGDKAKEILSALGFYEMINNPMQSEKIASITGSPIKILNPQSLDMAYLRTSLIPGALNVISHNIKVGEKDLALYEIGNVFNKKSETIKSFDDFEEKSSIVLILSGNLSEKGWNTEEKKYNFFSLKGLVDEFYSKFLLDNVLNDSYYEGVDRIFEYKCSKIHKNSILGEGGKIRNDILKQFDIDQEIYCFEINFDLLKKIPLEKKAFVEPLKFPKVFRDFAFIFNREIQFSEVSDFVKKNGADILRSVSLFDLFVSENLGENKKSMAFSLEYFSEEKTLTEEEVEEDFNNLISKVTKKFNAQLRGK